MKKVGEVARREYDQQEMFPSEFHEHYKVISHHMMIGEDGKSYWSASEITWRKSDTRRDS